MLQALPNEIRHALSNHHGCNVGIRTTDQFQGICASCTMSQARPQMTNIDHRSCTITLLPSPRVPIILRYAARPSSVSSVANNLVNALRCMGTEGSVQAPWQTVPSEREASVVERCRSSESSPTSIVRLLGTGSYLVCYRGTVTPRSSTITELALPPQQSRPSCQYQTCRLTLAPHRGKLCQAQVLRRPHIRAGLA